MRKPIVRLQLQSHVSLCADIVVHGDGNIDSVALGECHRQIQVDEEILKNLQGGGSAAERAVDSGGHHSHSPSGDRICQRYRDCCGAVLVRNDLRIDVESLGEVGAHTRRRADPRLLPDDEAGRGREERHLIFARGPGTEVGTIGPSETGNLIREAHLLEQNQASGDTTARPHIALTRCAVEHNHLGYSSDLQHDGKNGTITRN